MGKAMPRATTSRKRRPDRQKYPAAPGGGDIAESPALGRACLLIPDLVFEGSESILQNLTVRAELFSAFFVVSLPREDTMGEISGVRRRFVRAAMNAPFLEREEEHLLAVRWKEQRDETALHQLTA